MSATAQNSNSSWEYNNNWRKATSFDERINLLQIPSSILSIMGSEKLLDIVMEYPLLYNYFAYTNSQYAISKLVTEFNGAKELLGRKDFPEIIITKLEDLPFKIKKISQMSYMDKGDMSLKYMILERLALQKDFLQNLSFQQKNRLGNILSKNAELMRNNPTIFSKVHIENLNAINREESINDLITKPFDYEIVTTTFTPNYTYVNLKEPSSDFNANEIARLDAYYDSLYAIPHIASSTSTYNCHAYAWYMNGDTILAKYWMDDCNDYIDDWSYEQTEDTFIGQIVLYKTGQIIRHSAIYIGNGLYESKWGFGPLKRHEYYDCPYYDNGVVLVKYKRTTPQIVGSDYPCGTTTYYVTKTPPNDSIDVTWSYTSVPSNISATLTQNYPSKNSCTFNYNGTGIYTAYLTATVSRGGHVIGTATKKITNQFSITFSQIGRTYNGYTYPDIPETSIENNSTIAVSQMCDITISSPVFSTMTLTHTGASLRSWSKIGNTLFLSFPYNTSTPRPTAYISGTDGCRSVNLTVVSYSGTTPIPTLQITPASGGFEASLVYPSGDSEAVLQANRPSATVEWDLEVHHATSGEKVIGKHIVGACETINTSGWKSGIYIVTAKVDGQILTQKVTVK